MMSYECICMICKKHHTIKARFAPNTVIIITEDGKEYIRMSCGNHSSEEIVKANTEWQQNI